MKAKHKLSVFLESAQKAIDHRISKYYIPLTIILFFIVTYSYISRSIFNVDWHAWAVGDWLINYSAGFARRGLLGEIILRFSDFAHLRPNVMVVSIQIFFWCAFAILFLIRLFNKEITLYFFLLIFSPAFVIFYIFDTAAIGRKEIILMVLFLVWIFEIEKYKYLPKKLLLVFSAVIFFSTLMHEMFFFYSPYFLFAWWLKSSDDQQEQWVRASILVIFSFAAIALVIVFGGSLRAPEICQRLIAYEQKVQICEGILAAPESPFFESVRLFFATLSPLKLVSLVFSPVIPIFFVALFLCGVRSSRRSPLKIIIACLGLYAFSLPLFIVASDWGRFIHLHFVLSTLAMTLLLSPLQPSIRNPLVGDLLNMGEILRANAKIGDSLVALICVFILTMPLWRLKHCCVAYVDIFGPLKKIVELF